jgi:hypothetical protein
MKRGVGGVKNPSNCHLRKSQSSHGIAVLMNGCDRRTPSNARAYQWEGVGAPSKCVGTNKEHICICQGQDARGLWRVTLRARLCSALFACNGQALARSEAGWVHAKAAKKRRDLRRGGPYVAISLSVFKWLVCYKHVDWIIEVRLNMKVQIHANRSSHGRGLD